MWVSVLSSGTVNGVDVESVDQPEDAEIDQQCGVATIDSIDITVSELVEQASSGLSDSDPPVTEVLKTVGDGIDSVDSLAICDGSDDPLSGSDNQCLTDMALGGTGPLT